MPALTLREIPPELMERLRVVARRERRSVVQEALHLIEGGVAAREAALAMPEAQVQASRWRALAGRWQSAESFADEVAGLEAARSAGRSVDL